MKPERFDFLWDLISENRMSSADNFYFNRSGITWGEVTAEILNEIRELRGALMAGDKVRRDQLESWRFRLNIPEHIVGDASDVIDDLCESLFERYADMAVKTKELEDELELTKLALANATPPLPQTDSITDIFTA